MISAESLLEFVVLPDNNESSHVAGCWVGFCMKGGIVLVVWKGSRALILQNIEGYGWQVVYLQITYAVLYPERLAGGFFFFFCRYNFSKMFSWCTMFPTVVSPMMADLTFNLNLWSLCWFRVEFLIFHITSL